MDLKAFSRGEDIGPMMTFIQRGAQKPLIGAIEGFALAGGLELALTCDLLVAAKGAKLGIPEVNVGLFAAGGGLLRLPSRVGYGKAMEMAITGDPITAEDAARYGWSRGWSSGARRSTRRWSSPSGSPRNAPLAVAASKQLIAATQGATEDEFWALQQPLQAACSRPTTPRKARGRSPRSVRRSGPAADGVGPSSRLGGPPSASELHTASGATGSVAIPWTAPPPPQL
jgi:enoyl-CoA hydratase